MQARRIADGLRARELAMAVQVSGPDRMAYACGIAGYGSLDEWTKRAWASADALLFVSASGIAVRKLGTATVSKAELAAVLGK